jgi:hypothetical protein
MGEACSTYWRYILNASTILLGKPEWKRPSTEPRHRKKSNIKMGLKILLDKKLLVEYFEHGN